MFFHLDLSRSAGIVYDRNMLQEISPSRLFNEYKPVPPSDDDVVFSFAAKGPKVLIRAFDDDGHLPDRPITDSYPVIPKLVFPRVLDLKQNAPDKIASLLWLFRVDDTNIFLDTTADDMILPGYTFLTTRLFRRGLPKEFSFAGATAWHLRRWYMTNRFCGACGGALVPDRKERALRCPACGNVIYPRINPAVIVGVTNGDKIILSRYADGHQSSVYNAGAKTYKGLSLVAGYCEIGESIEDTVRREVREEVGLEVTNIRFYRSQPWGFDGALLLGLYCDVDGDDTIRVDSSELSEASWVSRADIETPVGTASLTSEMILHFRDGMG